MIPTGLLARLIEVESGGDPRAVSPVGAGGVMQIMPATARDPGYGVRPIADADRFNPAVAVPFGRDYLAAMIRQTGNVRDGLAAYNAGAGNIGAGLGYANKVIAARPSERSWQMARLAGGDGQEDMAGGSGSDVLGDPRERARGVFGTGTKTKDDALGDPRLRAKQVFAPKPSAVPAGEDLPAVSATGASDAQSQPQVTEGPPSKLERLGHGVMDVGHAVTQKYANAAEGLAGMLGFDVAPGKAYDQMLAARSKDYEARRDPDAGTDWWRIGGQAIPMLPAAVAGGSSLTASAGLGAMSGVLQPQEDGEYSAVEDLRRGGFGAAAGMVSGWAVKAASRLIGGLKDAAAPAVKELYAKGVRPLPSGSSRAAQRTESKLTSLPFAGGVIDAAKKRTFVEFNRAAYNDALAPIGKKLTTEPSRAALNEVKTAIGDAYEELLPNVTFVADDAFNSQLANLRSMASDLPGRERRTFNDIINRELIDRLGKTGRMDGESFKLFEQNISREMAKMKGSADYYQRNLSEGLLEVLKAAREGLARGNPTHAAKLHAANEAWGKYKVIEKAMAATRNKDEIFSPDQLLTAVRAKDITKDKSAFARGVSRMQPLAEAGKKVLSSAYPDSGTAGRTMLTDLSGLVIGAVSALPTAVYASPLVSRIAFAPRAAAARGMADLIERGVPLSALVGGSAAAAVMPLDDVRE